MTESSRQYLARLADTSEADVLPLVRGFVDSALESRGQNRLIDPDTDEPVLQIDTVNLSGGVIEVRESGTARLLFTVTVAVAE